MLARLIEFALMQRAFVLLASVLVCALGVRAYIDLPIDAFPDVSPAQVKIIMKAPGMTAEEVEARVIAPIEMELLGIPRQAILRSAAKFAIADITVDFDDGTDIYWARQQVAERLANALPDLPGNVEGGLAPISTPLSDVFMFTIEGGGLSLEEKRTLLDWTIRPALRTLPGVADVNALGGRVRTFEIVPDERALAAAGLTAADIAEAIEAGNRNDGAGRLADGEEALLVRSLGAVSTIDDIGQIVVARRGDGVIRIGDLARMQIGALTRYGAVTRDGVGEAVQGLVLSLKGADASDIVAAVRERLDELAPSFPEGVEIDVFYDRSDLIRRAVSTVRNALLEATVLVVILLLVFLADLRASVVVAVTLPVAALITFSMMGALGMSANLMSLGGLAIAIGLIVDAAVVVVENSVDRLEHFRSDRDTPKLHLVYRAASEVAAPVAAGILIICLVFLPLLSLQGLEGKLFAPVAVTIVISLGASLILSLTLIPVLASFLIRPGGHRTPALMRWLGPRYRTLLEFGLRRPAVVFIAAGAGVVAAAGAYLVTGKTFMPTMDEGDVIIQTAKLPTVNLERSVEGDLLVERAIMDQVPEVESIVSRVGADEIGLDPMGLNESDMFLVLKPKSAWRRRDKDWLLDQLREAMTAVPGIEYSFTQPIEMRTSEMLSGARGDVTIKVFGPDLETLALLAGRIETIVADVPGAAEVFTLSNDSLDSLEVGIDHLAAGRAGLTIADIETELRARLEGKSVGLVHEPGRRTEILVRGDTTAQELPETFARQQLATPSGGLIRLDDVATIRRATGPAKIDRENASRFAIVQAYVSDRDLVGFVRDAREAVAGGVDLPLGYRLAWGGDFENQRRAMARLGVVVPVALGLIFVVLFATLRSIRQSLLILANIPFAVVGGILALALSGQYLSVPASVGFIALLGIAVLNGLVLVAHFNQLLAEGMAIDRVVVEGAVRRLRPVLMTATIAAFGLVPLLFATGPGSEIQRPLAIVVIGGLATSTALTLILLPVLFQRYAPAPAGRLQASQEGREWAANSAG